MENDNRSYHSHQRIEIDIIGGSNGSQLFQYHIPEDITNQGCQDGQKYSHGKVGFTFESDDNDLPFGNLSDTISGGILISIIAIVAVFGLPVFILFVIFFFRYKNRKARYRLAEQAIAAGQPLPENFIRENRPADQRSQGIKNTFTGIGLFIFLWAITGEFGIGAIGLLIMFMGIGQWIIGSKQQKTDDVDPFRMNVSRKRDIDTAAPSATQQEERNGEKSDENK